MNENLSLVELLDVYKEIIDRQSDLIHELTDVVRKQALELQNIKTVYDLMETPEMDETSVRLPFR